ncbi:MAG TPA: hypothetical protein VE476_14665 [Propionibacteriaceae bacterium]|nr:hypothetical protein [Propionibacteriaceae bacterium]
MASAGTAVKALLVVAVVVIIAAGQEEESVPRTPNLHPSRGVVLEPSPTSSTNIPGGTLAACTGELIATETASVGERGGLTLQVFHSDRDGGRSCAVVTKTGGSREQRGELSVTLQLHNYDGQRWPRYAVHRHRGRAVRSDAIYLDDTNSRCIRAWARFDPDRARAVTLTADKLGCRWRSPLSRSRTPP